MRCSRRPALPLLPLLRAYAGAGLPSADELSHLPALGPRFGAILSARAGLLSEAFLDGAAPDEFHTTLLRFYEATVFPPLHAAVLTRRTGMVRHALAHLLRSPDPLSQKAERCLRADGPYHVAGLGPSFWTALFQALDSVRQAGWTPATVVGLRRLGLARWPAHAAAAEVHAGILKAHAHIRSLEPGLTGLHVDHFLTLAALMQGRDLWSGARRLETMGAGIDLEAVIRQERTRLPLRRRLKERGRALEQANAEVEAALACQDGARLGAALAVADPAGAKRAPLDWPAHGEELTLWVGRLWEADDPAEVLSAFWARVPVAGAGLWLPAAVLHLRDARRFLPWGEEVRQGYALLDDSADLGDTPAERYRLFNDGAAWLRERHGLHPLEVPAVLGVVGGGRGTSEGIDRSSSSAINLTPSAGFGGFCSDTFTFLRELERNNCREWMAGQRDRYRFAVRQPLVELCRALAERYVEPVLRRTHGWDVETAARSGHALTSVCKNDYGRSRPYNTVLWIAFCRRGEGSKRDDVQFFARLDADGLSYGLRLGREARSAGRLMRRNVQEHAEPLFRALAGAGALGDCRFGTDDGPAAVLGGPDDLRAWAAGKSLVAAKSLPPDHPLLTSDELVGEVLLTFDRLLPAYACAVQAEPLAFLGGRTPGTSPATRFDAADFCRATYLGDNWLARARELIDLKRQLILQGVPGTGKTHVARCLARMLTRGRDEAVRLVQFHPAYGYEDFVEGIKVKSIEVNGRHDVIYPVEDGLLCSFAAEAARRPSEPHVLIIDEINRGNLPRVFGELLYLLEYRGQTIALPYSRREFRLPANLYLVGTMNAADRSVALVDQALRRRFSFLEMPPDSAVLRAWLATHPPAAGLEFAAAVVGLFERLNARLRTDLGSQQQVGHSYFMVPDLDADRMRVVWDHHVRPLLEEYFLGHPERAAGYDLDRLLDGRAEPANGHKRRPTRTPR
jgi:5-methylcytosine-specific restriction enzyme B